jgi:hypothetical protein
MAAGGVVAAHRTFRQRWPVAQGLLRHRSERVPQCAPRLLLANPEDGIAAIDLDDPAVADPEDRVASSDVDPTCHTSSSRARPAGLCQRV